MAEASEVTPYPWATLDDLKLRWPDFPAGADAHATVLLEDASQFIIDTVPTAANATASTRRRIVCAVVRRSMETDDAGLNGLEQLQVGTGPFQMTGRASNPHGDFYLTKQEKKALGASAQKAFSVAIAPQVSVVHAQWCSINFGANYCSCGADIAGYPIYGDPNA